jgi:hypothetical protein
MPNGPASPFMINQWSRVSCAPCWQQPPTSVCAYGVAPSKKYKKKYVKANNVSNLIMKIINVIKIKVNLGQLSNA